jgi:class 3 adenylate cyclase
VSPGETGTSIDELLDRAVRAINRGDRATANTLAGRVLAVDHNNPEAEDVLAAPGRGGEIRRLTLMFVDLVDSTVLSTCVEPETYHQLVGRYRRQVVQLVEQYEGHIGETKGDGLMAVFGHPKAHEDDVGRAVAAGLDITRAVAVLSEQAQRKFGVAINARVGIHRGLVYLDTAADDVYGFSVNLTARVSALAEPGTISVSDAVAALINDAFDLGERQAAPVKGVEGLVTHYRVLAERSHSLPVPPPPLIGRYRERAWLEQNWGQAREGGLSSPGVAFRGEPGIGKTRLARAAADMVEESGGPVLELRGSPLHTDTGLHPVRRLLERRCGISRLTEGAERLRLLQPELQSHGLDAEMTVPLLAPVLGIGPEHGYRPVEAEGRRLHELIGATVQNYVLACLGDQPGLVIAEDVHWFDTSTMELLTALLANAGGRVLVALTGRDGPWLRTDWPVTLFDLTPLTDQESDALIEALDPTVTDTQREVVRQRCDGVPFYIEHVVAGLEAAGHEPGVPEALYEPLFARMHTRTDVVPVVEAAAVIGRSGDVALLRAVVGPDIVVDEVVAELVKARVIEPSGVDGWRFRHELLREVAAELAPPSLRRDLHARVARVLAYPASGVEPEWRVIAGHYEHAELFDEAVTSYQKACVDARRRGAMQEACDSLTNALDQLEHRPPGPDRDRREIAIRLERGLLAGAAHGGWGGKGPADLERCLELASTGMHEDELFATLTALTGYYVMRAELRKFRELLDSLSGRVTKDRPWSSAAIACSWGTLAWLEGDFSTARGHLQQVLADRSAIVARDSEAPWSVATDEIGAAHIYMAISHMMRGDLDGAETELAGSLRRCEELGFPKNDFNRAHTYFTDIWVRYEASQIDRAAVMVAEMRRLAEESGLDMWRGVAAVEHATVKGLAALRAGADEATLLAKAETIAQFVDGSRQMHLNLYLTVKDAIIGRLLIAAGRPGQARERLQMALTHADETGMHFHDAELMRVHAGTFTETDQRRARLAAARELAADQGATLFELRCALDDFEIAGESAKSTLADVVRRFPGDTRWPERVRAEQLLGRG